MLFCQLAPSSSKTGSMVSTHSLRKERLVVMGVSLSGLYTATVLVTLWVICKLAWKNRHLWILTDASTLLLGFSPHYTRLQKNYTFAYVLVMYMCSTMHSSLVWQLYSSAINNSEHTDGAMLITSLATIEPWLYVTASAFFCFNIFLADCLFVRSKPWSIH